MRQVRRTIQRGKKYLRLPRERLGDGMRRLLRVEQSASAVAIALHALLSSREQIGIVQIGANDGRFNDPIYPFVANNADRTRMLLVEPQTTVLPYLEANYEFHPNALIANNAVGPGGDITLFAIGEEHWGDCIATYADPDWPDYRAPTGVTSTNRERVVKWAYKYYSGSSSPESVVVTLTIASVRLSQIIESSGFQLPIDVLQIDAEGFDDQVIYHSDLETYRPTVVNFESVFLTSERKASLYEYLRSSGYEVITTGLDTLAILRDFRP